MRSSWSCEILLSFRKIYLKEFEVKIEYQGKNATFLDLGITIDDGIFSYKLFCKRDKF